jgi:uncharacterized LabA/DUF88 family protein
MSQAPSNYEKPDIRKGDDILILADPEWMVSMQGYNPSDFGIRFLARKLASIANLLGKNRELVAIVSTYDGRLQRKFQKEKFLTVPVNGDRPEKVPSLAQEIFLLTLEARPRHVIIVSGDPTLIRLSDELAKYTYVSLWYTGNALPPSCPLVYVQDIRPLKKVISDEQIAVFIDFENIFCPINDQGLIFDPWAFVQTIKRNVEEIGKYSPPKVYADWKVINELAGDDLQHKLAAAGAQTIYQISRKGKNSSDMAIANDIRSLMEGDNAPDRIFLLSEDRDFEPVITTLQSSETELSLLVFSDYVSRRLLQSVHDIIRLNIWNFVRQPS